MNNFNVRHQLRNNNNNNNIKVENDVERMVGMIKELVMVRDGSMSLSGDMFLCADIWALIDLLCSY